MAGETLFGRVYEIRIGKPGQRGKVWRSTPDAPGLQVSFEVEMTLRSRSDKARLTMVNLSRESVGFIEQEGNVLTIIAGYTGNAAQIFQGEIARRGVTSSHEGTDRITEIEAGASELALMSTRFSKSYAAGTPIKTVLGDLVSAFGVGRGNLDRLTGTERTYSAGAVFFGDARSAMDEVVAQLGAGWTWSITDGALMVLAPGQTVEQSAVLLSPQSGLIGAPRRQQRGLEVVSLMQPKIKPGKLLRVRSADFDGFYKVQKALFTGEARGGEWYTRAECKGVG